MSVSVRGECHRCKRTQELPNYKECTKCIIDPKWMYKTMTPITEILAKLGYYTKRWQNIFCDKL